MKIPPCLLLIFAPALLSAAPLSLVAQLPLADLKSFFHGEPAMPPKSPAPKVSATVSTAEGVATDKPAEDFLRALATAIKARDGQSMLPRLADKFEIPNLPDGLKSPAIFAQGIDRTPGPTALVVLAIEARGATRVAKVEVRYAAVAKTKSFTFDADSKLLTSDLFAVKLQTQGE